MVVKECIFLTCLVLVGLIGLTGLTLVAADYFDIVNVSEGDCYTCSDGCNICCDYDNFNTTTLMFCPNISFDIINLTEELEVPLEPENPGSTQQYNYSDLDINDFKLTEPEWYLTILVVFGFVALLMFCLKMAFKEHEDDEKDEKEEVQTDEK